MFRRQSCTWALAFVIAGCSDNRTPSFDDPTYDSKQAHDTLVAALDAWQKDRTKELSLRKPPIKLTDDDARSGMKLVRYEIVDPSTIGPFQDVAVKLELKTRDGRPISRAVTYQIMLKPAIFVARSDT